MPGIHRPRAGSPGSGTGAGGELGLHSDSEPACQITVHKARPSLPSFSLLALGSNHLPWTRCPPPCCADPLTATSATLRPLTGVLYGLGSWGPSRNPVGTRAPINVGNAPCTLQPSFPDLAFYNPRPISLSYQEPSRWAGESWTALACGPLPLLPLRFLQVPLPFPHIVTCPIRLPSPSSQYTSTHTFEK